MTPTTIRMTPTVLMSTPSTCAVTAYLRIAPTAIRNREVPMVTPTLVDRERRGASLDRATAEPGLGRAAPSGCGGRGLRPSDRHRCGVDGRRPSSSPGDHDPAGRRTTGAVWPNADRNPTTSAPWSTSPPRRAPFG